MGHSHIWIKKARTATAAIHCERDLALGPLSSTGSTLFKSPQATARPEPIVIMLIPAGAVAVFFTTPLYEFFFFYFKQNRERTDPSGLPALSLYWEV